MKSDRRVPIAMTRSAVARDRVARGAAGRAHRPQLAAGDPRAAPPCPPASRSPGCRTGSRTRRARPPRPSRARRRRPRSSVGARPRWHPRPGRAASRPASVRGTTQVRSSNSSSGKSHASAWTSCGRQSVTAPVSDGRREHPERGGQRGHQLLRPVDAVPVARHGPERVVDAHVLALRSLQLLEHRASRAGCANRSPGQQQHRQPVHGRGRGARDHVRGAGADGAGAGEGRAAVAAAWRTPPRCGPSPARCAPGDSAARRRPCAAASASRASPRPATLPCPKMPNTPAMNRPRSPSRSTCCCAKERHHGLGGRQTSRTAHEHRLLRSMGHPQAEG